MTISLVGNGFVVKAEGTFQENGNRLSGKAHRYPFSRGKYHVLIEEKADSAKAFSGTLPELGSLFVDEKHGKTAFRSIRLLADAIKDPAPLFDIPRSYNKEEHTKYLTTKELIVLVSIQSGITDSGEIAKLFGIHRSRVYFAKLELNSSGFICTRWTEHEKKLELSESGKKFFERAAAEHTIKACQRWFDFMRTPEA